jgi:hypothetical protein
MNDCTAFCWVHIKGIGGVFDLASIAAYIVGLVIGYDILE